VCIRSTVQTVPQTGRPIRQPGRWSGNISLQPLDVAWYTATGRVGLCIVVLDQRSESGGWDDGRRTHNRPKMAVRIGLYGRTLYSNRSLAGSIGCGLDVSE
jgi:hypothetical protein